MTSSEKNYIPLAKMLMDKGYICLTVNFRGHGDSKGDYSKLTVNDAYDDAQAVYDYSLSRYPVKKVGICGTSLGGAVASMLTAHRPVDSLVLRAPAAYSTETMQLPFPSIIPAYLYEAFFKNAAKTRSKKEAIIKSATHALLRPEWRNEFNNYVVSWFADTLI